MAPEDADSEKLDLGNNPQVFENLSRFEQRLKRVDEQHHAGQLNFTERLMDEQKPAGTRTYIAAYQLIGTARENYEAVFSLLRSGATPIAPYNLLRPAFEAAFFALWMLDPDDPVERCTRGLRVAIEDNRQKKNWLTELVKIPGMTADQKERLLAGTANASTVYHREADELGVKWAALSQKVLVEQELSRLSNVRSDSKGVVSPTVVAAWRQLSGYQHGHMYAVLSGSTQKVVKTISGGVNASVTIDDESFGLSLQVAALMQLWAMNAYVGRTERPSRPVGPSRTTEPSRTGRKPKPPRRS